MDNENDIEKDFLFAPRSALRGEICFIWRRLTQENLETQIRYK